MVNVSFYCYFYSYGYSGELGSPDSRPTRPLYGPISTAPLKEPFKGNLGEPPEIPQGPALREGRRAEQPMEPLGARCPAQQGGLPARPPGCC